MGARLLDAAELCRRCDPALFSFETTAGLEPLAGRVGQERAVDALQFGVGMRHDGYNLFAMGPAGSGKHTAVRAMLVERAASEPVPRDVCYVHNFASPAEPRALLLPPGTGRLLRDDVRRLVGELRTVIPGAVESEEFRAHKLQLEEEAKARHGRALGAFRDRAAEKHVTLVETPFGFALAPARDGEVIAPDAFVRLPEGERERYKADLDALSGELGALVDQTRRWEQELRGKLKDLVRETLKGAVGHLLGDLEKKYADHPEVTAHLGALGREVLDSSGDFMKPEEGSPLLALGDDGAAAFRRYQVNLLVDNEGQRGAPIVYEDHPGYDRLVGRVEHLARFGAMVTDVGLIKPGMLHKANGGYLILDARNLILQPFAWDGLKRALSNKEVRIEPPGQLLSLSATASLEPEPVPLSVKVVLLGERVLYHLLQEVDPDFMELFKVMVDFEDDIPRTPDNDVAYARLVATIAGDGRLRPFDRSGVARVIDRCARLAEDATRLCAHMGAITDLIREADHWAGARGAGVVSAEDVDAAVATEERRAGRVRERLLEQITRGTQLIETRGGAVGQINGLSVIALGRSSFGRPTRITARVRLGRGEVLDIEREVDLSGPLHSKGVLILAGFLGARYATDQPLSLSATLAFEQSYGPIDGDSASSAELYALLSALAEVPIQQSLAVTGSVNQHGEVQAIGGVNEKIEGFFDLCSARGLTGAEGVMIPASNVENLMLRRDVVDAVRAGRFHVWAVSTIDEGIELCTGLPAGARGADGKFPEGSVNAKVEDRLKALARMRLAASAGAGAGKDGARDA